MDHTVSLDYQQVRDEYLRVMNERVERTTDSTKCTAAMVWDVLGLASVTRRSVHASCESLEDAPTGEGVLYQLRKGWLAELGPGELEDELNALLVQRLPGGIPGRAHQVACDLTFIPYHGEAQDSGDEVRRSQAKSGTTHFHVYASAYLIGKNKRVTLAVAYWQADQTLVEVLLRLLARLEALGIRLNRLLLDRQFCTVEIIRYLDEQPWQSILPVPARSDHLKDLQSTARRSHAVSYTMHSPTAGVVCFTLHVVCRYAQGRRGKQGMERFLFAVLGRPWRSTPALLAETYRTRFGIETAYRLMNSVRARTSSRDPKLRFLLVGLAFVLLNLWVTLQWAVLALPRQGGRWLHPALFPLQRFCDFLRDAIAEIRHLVRVVSRPAALPCRF
jgi:putative transposase